MANDNPTSTSKDSKPDPPPPTYDNPDETQTPASKPTAVIVHLIRNPRCKRKDLNWSYRNMQSRSSDVVLLSRTTSFAEFEDMLRRRLPRHFKFEEPFRYENLARGIYVRIPSAAPFRYLGAGVWVAVHEENWPATLELLERPSVPALELWFCEVIEDEGGDAIQPASSRSCVIQ